MKHFLIPLLLSLVVMAGLSISQPVQAADGYLTITADESLAVHRRVKVDADGKCTYADATDVSDATVTNAAASGAPASLRFKSAAGARDMVAASAVSVGDIVFGADDGKVDDIGFIIEGKALEAATTDGDIIKVAPFEIGHEIVATVAAAGSSQGDAAALTNPINVVTGADGTKGVVLPAAQAGLVIDVYSSTATNGLKVYPATGDDINDGSANAAVTIEGKTHSRFIAVDGSTWAAIYTADS